MTNCCLFVVERVCIIGMAVIVQSGVCIIEAGCFNVFTSDGRDYIAALPFPVSSVLLYQSKYSV